MGILYSFWLLGLLGSVGITVIGLGRLLSDVDDATGAKYTHTDGRDVITFLTGVGVSFFVAIGAPNLDFLCNSTAASCVNGVQTYTNLYPFAWVFGGIAMVNLLFVFISIVLMIRIKDEGGSLQR